MLPSVLHFHLTEVRRVVAVTLGLVTRMSHVAPPRVSAKVREDENFSTARASNPRFGVVATAVVQLHVPLPIELEGVFGRQGSSCTACSVYTRKTLTSSTRNFCFVILQNRRMSEQYKPLPEGLTIKESGIEGLGLFALRDFPSGHNFGISHIKNGNFENGYIRTPLGGFYNHSEDPNCRALIKGEYWYLTSIKEIKAGDELMVKYTLYDPGKTDSDMVR